VQLVWGKHVDHADFAAQIGGVSRDPVQHTVGISLRQRLSPNVRRVEFPGCIATGRVRHLLQLEPQSSGARGHSDRVQEILLADYYGRALRQEPGLRLCARNASARRAAGEVDQREAMNRLQEAESG